MTYDIRTGDTWRSEKGGRLVTVVPRSDYYVWHNRPDAGPLDLVAEMPLLTRDGKAVTT